MTRELKAEAPIAHDEYGPLRLISLDEAAKILRVYPHELIDLATTDEIEPREINMVHGLGGPWFDANEIETLDMLWSLDEKSD